jgi:hypothetical protein
MKLQELRELYVSPNGDRWDVGRDSSGRLQVVHTLLDIGTFLSMRHNLGPEHQALIQLLRSGSLDWMCPLISGAYRN